MMTRFVFMLAVAVMFATVSVQAAEPYSGFGAPFAGTEYPGFSDPALPPLVADAKDDLQSAEDAARIEPAAGDAEDESSDEAPITAQEEAQEPVFGP